MKHASRVAIIVAVVTSCASTAFGKTIEFPCMRNTYDGRILVDGPQWAQKMRSIGYRVDNEAHVAYEVIKFSKVRKRDIMWDEGKCKMRLIAIGQ